MIGQTDPRSSVSDMQVFRTFLTVILLCAILAGCTLPETVPPGTQQGGTPGNSPDLPAGSTGSPPVVADTASPRAYITFVINVNDWVHPDEYADTILRLVDIFEHYKVRGDFYFTAEITRCYVEQYPDVIERLKNSAMTISYHVRPPHPLYTGFDQRLQNLGDAALYQTLLDYETYALDLGTGDLDRSHQGGYTYVAHVFGRNPVVAPAPNNDPRIKNAAWQVYASLGVQMTLLYHEEGTDPYQPYVFMDGLLVRPSDFSVTRTTEVNGRDDFWWNYMTGPDAALYDPSTLLQSGLAEWESHAYGRPPFVTSLIHENNYYRSGAEAWSAYYFVMEQSRKTDPLAPPFDLNAPDPSQLRPTREQDAIWNAYENLVAWAAANLQVVTSEDILRLAGEP